MPCACQIPVPDYPANADWGPILWNILHSLAEKAGQAALPADELREWPKFIKLTGEVLPCDKCRAHYIEYTQANPLTLSMPYVELKTFLKTWFWKLHNDVNTSSGKPIFAYNDLETRYDNPNFQDLLWRLEPIMKNVIQLNGVSFMKWTKWIHSFKMLRAILGL
jgi:hypothetical protein